MSSKKIPSTIGFDPEVYDRLVKEKSNDRRSISFIVNESLREHFNMPGAGGRVKENAN